MQKVTLYLNPHNLICSFRNISKTYYLINGTFSTNVYYDSLYNKNWAWTKSHHFFFWNASRPDDINNCPLGAKGKNNYPQFVLA